MGAQGDWAPPNDGEYHPIDQPQEREVSRSRDGARARSHPRANARTRARSRLLPLLIVVAMVAACAGGFLWRRHAPAQSQLGVTPASDSCTEGPYRLCLADFVPLQPSGSQLDSAEAGPFFSKAVDATYAADDTVRLAVAGGDLASIHAAASQARDTAQQAAETLASRTWPESLDKPVRMVIIEYQERAAIYEAMSSSNDIEGIDWLAFNKFRASDSQHLIRTTLELPDEPQPALPFEVSGISDDGTCPSRTGGASGGASGDGTEAARRCLTITAVSRVPAEVTSFILTFNIASADGTIRETGLQAISSLVFDAAGNLVDHGGIRAGNKVGLDVEVASTLLRDGDRFVPSGWSVHDYAGDVHLGSFTPVQAGSSQPFRDFAIGGAAAAGAATGSEASAGGGATASMDDSTAKETR